MPADEEWSRGNILRAVVADALQRNGQVVDEDTLEATIASVSGPGGALAQTPLVWKLNPGESRSDGRMAPPFHGYAVEVPAATQAALVGYAKTWSAQRDAAPEAPVDASIEQLKQLARSGGHGDVAQTLEALEAAIKAGSAASQAGKPVDAVAMAAVLEFALKSGREREAAKILERYTAVKGVATDAKAIGRDATRVFNGRDPITRKPLDTDQRVDAAFDLLSNGFKLAGNIGSTAMMMGIRSPLVTGLIGVAPAGVAIVAFAAGAYELIKRAREALLAPRWDEFRERFPFAEGLEPRKAINGIMRQISGMPTDAGNALSTATRVLDAMGENAETRERFLAFLKQKVQPESLVDVLASGQGLERLTAQQAMELARAAKGSSKEFLDLELQDVKRYVRDRDGDRERGTYLLPPAQQEAANRNTNKLGGALDEGLRVAGILSSSANSLNGMYKDMLDKVKGVDTGAAKLDEQQQKNLAAALVPVSRDGGLTQVDHLFASKDGSKLFAVQGDPASANRRMVSIDVAAGSSQSLEVSSQLAARNMAAGDAPTQQTTQGAGRGF
ncbi:hypothetical protein DX914_15170 [Lysobacter silvisoli]|uniref:X-Tfes XVIPCD domain-containing protein n=1 Tax=Lysobacter silvisoli TaxID=2293254 RepID=A0A371JXF8_9GAMM|nr:hypothetical protein DX914_15170 [Lysobacter silvisoli]